MINRKLLNPFLISVILIIIIFLLMNYLGYFQPENVNISHIYYADNISTAHAELIKRFNLKYKGQIEVIPIDLPFSKFSTNERKELLARSLRSKSDLIDVFAVDLIWAPRFAKWCQPLDLYFDSKLLKQLVPYALQSCYYENQLVAIPLYADIGLMYYREDLIKKFPNSKELEFKLKKSITWEELISLGEDLPHPNNPFYIYQAKNYEGLVCNFFELLACQSGSIMKGDSIELNTPEARKAVQFLTDLVNKYKLTPSIVTTFDEYQSYIYTLDNDGIFLRGWPGFSK
ncbi:MAG: extracellular solute-binding protein, partial [Calditrichota bacterium]